MDYSILSDPKVYAGIVSFAVTHTQLLKPAVIGEEPTKWKYVTLPFISIVLGLLASYVVLVVPKDILPLLAAIVSGSTGSGGYGATKDLLKSLGGKKESVVITETVTENLDEAEPPIDYKPI